MSRGSNSANQHYREIGLGTMLFASTIITIGLSVSAISLERHFRGENVSPMQQQQSFTVRSVSNEVYRDSDPETEAGEYEPNLPSWARVTRSSISEEEETQSHLRPDPPLTTDETVRPDQSSTLQPNLVEMEQTEFAPADTTVTTTSFDEAIEIEAFSEPETELAEIQASEFEIAPAAPPLGFPIKSMSAASPPPQGESMADEQPHPTSQSTWRVQLASLTEQADAEKAWTRLQKRHEELLGDLQLQVEVANLSKGTYYRVTAGPLDTKNTATSLCNTLKSRKTDCLVVAP